MGEEGRVVVLVHGAFAESASWNGVVEQLQANSVEVIAAANPLRGIENDAAYVRDVVAGIGTPVTLVGHSYGGVVITEAASDNNLVMSLVYVCAFAPDHGESVFELAGKFPGSMLRAALRSYPVSTGTNDLAMRGDAFHYQFAADVPASLAATMYATQRPVTEAALVTGLPTQTPAWKTLPSWFAFADEDLNIPITVHRFMAERAGAKGIREVAGASHALNVSNPDVVTAAILDALAN